MLAFILSSSTLYREWSAQGLSPRRNQVLSMTSLQGLDSDLSTDQGSINPILMPEAFSELTLH